VWGIGEERLLNMRITKTQLRECARAALEQRRGYVVTVDKGQGFVPGARLTAIRGGKEIKVAVRTSLDREIGFMRDRQGNWRTIPKVDLVVVAVPADDKVGKRPSVEVSVEVFGFDPKVLKREFDAALAAQRERPLLQSPYFRVSRPGLWKGKVRRNFRPEDENAVERGGAAELREPSGKRRIHRTCEA
jgi:hypothetical protein